MRLPCPLAGPSYLVTASEVATLQFAREVLQLPVPRVITWSGAIRNLVNHVGTDYIIMEEVPGVRLGHRWLQFATADDVRPIMNSMLDIEAKFESLRFSRIGSLYFKEDVSADLQGVPLLSGVTDSTTQQLSERYCVGPLMVYQWWRGERARMALDRGPCKIPLSSIVISSLIFFPFQGLTRLCSSLPRQRMNKRSSISIPLACLGIVENPHTTTLFIRGSYRCTWKPFPMLCHPKNTKFVRRRCGTRTSV